LAGLGSDNELNSDDFQCVSTILESFGEATHYHPVSCCL
jgi:hypothetical protein